MSFGKFQFSRHVSFRLFLSRTNYVKLRFTLELSICHRQRPDKTFTKKIGQMNKTEFSIAMVVKFDFKIIVHFDSLQKINPLKTTTKPFQTCLDGNRN